MRNKRKTAIVFCSIMLLGGCGNAGTGVVETALEPRAQETETAQSDNSAETDGVRETSFGSVRRLSTPWPQQAEQGQTMY